MWLVVTKGKAPIRQKKNLIKLIKLNFFKNSFFGDEFLFSDYYLKTYFKKEKK